MHKPFSPACEQNRDAIADVLSAYLQDRHEVLEIGSGTGQHAVYFAERFPWLRWATSDLRENHPGIQAWIDDSGLDNVMSPIELDSRGDWPESTYELVFSANCLHIMSDTAAEAFIANVGSVMRESAVLVVYGPFNFAGRYTSESNERFDDWLKARDQASGIKNFEWIEDIAAVSGLEFVHNHAMPANNHTLVWRRR